MRIRQFFQHLSVIDGGVAVGDLDAAPAFQGRKHHEYVGDAVAFVFVIVTRGLSGFGGDRRAGLDDQLFGGFIQTHERAIGIARFLVGFQHIFHRGDEAGVGVRRDHPLPIAVRFERVFFSVRPIVLSLTCLTMFSSTTFSSSRRRLQRANPSGAGEQVRAINLASAAPSKIRGRAEFGLYLRFSVASNPSSTSCCRVRETVLMLVSSAAEIALSLHPSPPSDTSAFSRMRALVSSCAELLPARINASSRSRSSMVNFTTYFLPAISFPATNHLHRCIAATEIQRNTPDSRTRATSRPSHTVVGELLKGEKFSLQANRKTREGDSHPDRDAQFAHINASVSRALVEQQPVISVDTKKKELVGDFKNGGREWRPQGDPEAVRVHDFLIKELGRAVPYGIYDLAANA